MSTRKGMNLKQVKNQLELLEGILEQDATARHKNISSRYALRIAQACVNKQIPKKPDIQGDGYDPDGNLVYDTWICPACGVSYEIDYDEYDYCPSCGQAIDWSDEE